jgi:MFS family permease
VFAPSWEWVTVGAVIMGFTGIYQPALEALIADSIPPERRGMGFGIVRLIGSVSTTPSPLIAGFLYLRMGLIQTMQLSYGLAALGFVVAALMRTRLKETVENPSKIDIASMARSYPISFRESINVWGKVERSAFVLFIINVVTFFTIGIFMPVFTLFIVDDLGIPEFQLSLIMASMFITMIIFALPSGKIVDMMDKKKPMLASYIIWIFAVPLFIFGDFWRIILAMTFIGVLQVLFSSAAGALMADLVPKEHRGKVNGSMGFFSLIGHSVGQLFGGWMYDNVSHSLPFWIQIGLMIPVFIFTLMLIKEPQKIQK